jgi:hypothetical protein
METHLVSSRKEKLVGRLGSMQACMVLVGDIGMESPTEEHGGGHAKGDPIEI